MTKHLETVGLSRELALQLVEGVLEGDYHLLLGAGFSCSAISANSGETLPTGWGLSERINKDFSLGFSESELGNLKEVYEDAIHSENCGRKRLSNYLKSIFLNTVPTWHYKVLKFRWARIWNLNIDDVLDNAQKNPLCDYRINVTNWQDRLKADVAGSTEIQVIHLHGRAKLLDEELRGLIFSLEEYAGALLGHGSWHSEFWSNWYQRPFLVVGATLREEFDLEIALERGTNSYEATGRSTIAVLKSVDSRQRKKLERRNIAVAECSAEVFFEALQSDLDQFLVENPGRSAGALSTATQISFIQQFDTLSLTENRQRNNRDFFGGDEPTWQDILANKDAFLHKTEEASEYLFEDAQGTTDLRVALLSGSPASGRSSALFRLARVAISHGKRPYIFREEKSIDTESIATWLAANPNSILIFDNAGDFGEGIGDLLKKIEAHGTRAVVILAERDARTEALRSDLNFDARIFVYRTIHRNDVERVRERRLTFGRMGQATEWSIKEWRDFFLKDHSGDLFSSLSALEGGGGFRRRMDQEYQRLTGTLTTSQVNVLAGAALTHRLGYSLPTAIATQLMKGSGQQGDLTKDFREIFGDILVVDRNGFRLRHRQLADHFVKDYLNIPLIYNVTKNIAALISPLLNPQVMGNRTYSYRLLRAMMDRRVVLALFGQNTRAAREWYSELSTHYSWNGRYWDQRALLESDAGSHDTAYSFSKRSVSLHRHAFSLNTLGVVRCRAAVQPNITPDDAWDFFSEGNAALLDSRSNPGSGELREHPYITFFTYALQLRNLLKERPSFRSKLASMWEDWMHSADRIATSQSSFENKLRDFRSDWLRFW
ncbi:hypothetical protein [Tahibacter caeni]|uniref:P-loop NTPase n=1 Tax=Tahibacter caeni TaxID=1453545 RepID=UPI00214740E9|nr:hypothetical protein [Tahibacter caeni]